VVAKGPVGVQPDPGLRVELVQELGLGELALALLPATAAVVFGTAVAQRVIRHVSVRSVAIVGMAIAAVGLLLPSQLPTHGTYPASLLPWLTLTSIGMTLTFVPVTLIATTNVAAIDAGVHPGSSRRPSSSAPRWACGLVGGRGAPDDEQSRAVFAGGPERLGAGGWFPARVRELGWSRRHSDSRDLVPDPPPDVARLARPTP
jgi:hypothetical protein